MLRGLLSHHVQVRQLQARASVSGRQARDASREWGSGGCRGQAGGGGLRESEGLLRTSVGKVLPGRLPSPSRVPLMGHTHLPFAPPRDLPLGSSDFSEDSPLSTPPPSPLPLPNLIPPLYHFTHRAYLSTGFGHGLLLSLLNTLPPLPPHCPVPPTHTPANSPLLASLLTCHPNNDFTTHLLQGFTWGFKVGYTGPQCL